MYEGSIKKEFIRCLLVGSCGGISTAEEANLQSPAVVLASWNGNGNWSNADAQRRKFSDSFFVYAYKKEVLSSVSSSLGERVVSNRESAGQIKDNSDYGIFVLLPHAQQVNCQQIFFPFPNFLPHFSVRESVFSSLLLVDIVGKTQRKNSVSDIH